MLGKPSKKNALGIRKFNEQTSSLHSLQIIMTFDSNHNTRFECFPGFYSKSYVNIHELTDKKNDLAASMSEYYMRIIMGRKLITLDDFDIHKDSLIRRYEDYGVEQTLKMFSDHSQYIAKSELLKDFSLRKIYDTRPALTNYVSSYAKELITLFQKKQYEKMEILEIISAGTLSILLGEQGYAIEN